MTYRECYQEGQSALVQSGIEEAALDARLLLEYVCGTDRNDLLVHGDQPVDDEKYQRYRELIRQRGERIPLQHLTGEQNFMGLSFQVNRHVLIPRQDTEILVEEALKHLHDGMRILDMCTGSGCILVSLLHYSNDCTGVGVDISKEALKTAECNARNILAGDSPCFCFLQSDLFTEVEGTFDMIVSNPPYIPTEVIDTLMPEVRAHEPLNALDGYEDGLYFYRKITAQCGDYLSRGGMLFFEIGYDQGEAVSALLRDNDFAEVQVLQDYAGLDRVVYGVYMGPP